MPNSWRSAFLKQAQADFTMAKKLRRQGDATCHWLHYLQMATEKLAKGYTCSELGNAPPHTHSGFTRFIQKGAPSDGRLWAVWGRDLKSRRVFRTQVRRLVPVARLIESLAPALAQSGPNPEYPWEDLGGIQVPVEYPFSELSEKSAPQIENLFRFLDTCFRALRS
jgi:hypothetical protein